MFNINKIAVICGGSSSEREISLKSGEAIHGALMNLGFRSEIFDFNKLNNLENLQSFDKVFIALHGHEGEGGKLQENLESLNIDYTGSNFKGCKNTWNKEICKNILNENNIRTPNAVSTNLLDNFNKNPFDEFQNKYGYSSNLFMKPAEDGSSIDIFKLINNNDFLHAKKSIKDSKRNFIFEEEIVGKEFTVSVINNNCLPPIEIKTENDFYDYDAKYISESTNLIQARLNQQELSEINEISLNAFHSLGCKNWARVDFLQDLDGKFYVIEINTVPGMTSHSCVPKSGSFLGWSYESVVMEILNINE